MEFRRERIRLETARHVIEGTLQLPSEGFRSRTTDYLNAHGESFLALTDVRVEWIDGSRAAESHAYVAVAARHVLMALELGAVDAA